MLFPYHESDHVLNIAFNLLARGTRRFFAARVASISEVAEPSAGRDRMNVGRGCGAPVPLGAAFTVTGLEQ